MRINQQDMTEAQDVLRIHYADMRLEERQLLELYIEAGRTREPFHEGLGATAREIVQTVLAKTDA